MANLVGRVYQEPDAAIRLEVDQIEAIRIEAIRIEAIPIVVIPIVVTQNVAIPDVVIQNAGLAGIRVVQISVQILVLVLAAIQVAIPDVRRVEFRVEFRAAALKLTPVVRCVAQIAAVVLVAARGHGLAVAEARVALQHRWVEFPC